MGRIFGFAWWDFAGVPEDVTYFIHNVNPVFVMMDSARGRYKLPNVRTLFDLSVPLLFLTGLIQLFLHLVQSVPSTECIFISYG